MWPARTFPPWRGLTSMKSHRRSRTWRTADCARTGLPAFTRLSRKLMSTASTRYTLHCARWDREVRFHAAQRGP